MPVGYDISPLKRVRLKMLTTRRQRVEEYRNPHGQLKENLFLPLFNTNFISKFEINAGKGYSTCEGPPNSLPSRLEEDGSVFNQFQ